MTTPRMPHRPAAATARQSLRDGLAPLHDALDARVSDTCLEPRPDLCRLLALHAAALPALVAGLEAAGAADLWPGWDEPARLDALSADLAALGLPLPEADPIRFAPIPFTAGPQAWGGLYALLGSRLGNRVILRRFAEAGLPADSAFLRFGEADRARWPAFLATLDAAADAVALAGMLEGGRRVMQRYLDALPHRPHLDPRSGHRSQDAAVPA